MKKVFPNLFTFLFLLTLVILWGKCAAGGKKKKDGNKKFQPSETPAANLLENKPTAESSSKNMSSGTEGGDQQKKREKGKAKADAEPNPSIFAKAKDLEHSLSDFHFETFLKKEIASPQTNNDYNKLLKDALQHLSDEKDEEGTIAKIIELLHVGLHDRTLRYIRLIGAGSLRQHNDHHIYNREAREEHLGAMKLLEKKAGNLAQKYKQMEQIVAIYQLALAKRIAEHFSVEPSNVTVEDMHLAQSEMDFLHQQFGYTPILGDNGPEGNLAKIPEQINTMDAADDVTMVIMINSSIEMTSKLLKSYSDKGLTKQLIMLESSMYYEDAIIARLSQQDINNLDNNLRTFQMTMGGVRLPRTKWTQLVYDYKKARIYYYNEEI